MCYNFAIGEVMFEAVLTKLENKFEDIKEDVDKGKLYLFAMFDTEKLLEEMNNYYSLWSNLSITDKETLRRLKALITQANEYLQDLIDLVDIDKSLLS